MTQRALQSVADATANKAEDADFPHLCEGCLGENPYVRMQKIPFGGNCKMCDRAFTLFKWRPGRGEGYKKTEVCQTCSRLKNICQTCILDLQFGLPSQLRDAVLAEVGEVGAIPESDAGKEYQSQRQMLMLESGDNPWQNQQTPNEMLLDIARSAVKERKQSRVKLPGLQQQKRTHEEAFQGQETINTSVNTNTEWNTKIINQSIKDIAHESIELPPGVSDMNKLIEVEQKLPSSLRSNPSIAIVVSSSNEKTIKKPILPPKPPGPPPPWAFKNSNISIQSSKVGPQ